MHRSLLAAAVASSVACLVASPTTASADTTGGTPVTVTVTGGAIAITVPTSTVSLGSVAVSENDQTVSQTLGGVTVTDQRGSSASWTASASAVDFSDGNGHTISVTTKPSSYDPGNIATTGVTATGHVISPIYPAQDVVTTSNLSASNTASWNPTMSITVPGNTLVGTYSSTVTHSVS
jgi:hypothetical protein